MQLCLANARLTCRMLFPLLLYTLFYLMYRRTRNDRRLCRIELRAKLVQKVLVVS